MTPRAGKDKHISANRANLDDTKLLELAAHKGNRRALQTLHERYYERMLRYIASRIGYGTQAEDLAQDVFVEICKGNANYDGSTAVPRYLLGIAKNAIRKYQFNQRVWTKILKPDAMDRQAVCHGGQQHRSPIGHISEQELKTAIEHRIAQLSPKTRDAIRLRFVEGLKPAEAAKKAGCSAKVLYDRVAYGLKALRERNGQTGRDSAALINKNLRS